MNSDANSQPIKTPKGEQTRALILSELGLRPRLFAATVFAVAAAFPVVWFFFIFGGARGSNFESLHFFPVLFFGIVPVSAAALCGFTVGSRLADGSETITDFRAAGRGVAVALLSYVLFMAFWLGAIVLGGVLPNQSQNPSQNWSIGGFLGWFAVMFVFGLVFIGWLIVGAGAFAGLLLKYISTSSWFRQRWNTSVRVPASEATRWKILAGLLFMFNYLIFVLIFIFKVARQM